MIPVDELHRLFEYNPDTGFLYWRVSPRANVQAGDEAGSTQAKGYRVIVISRHSYKAHRIAWAMVTGVWPTHDIDHINRVSADNRWLNLREATRSENLQNVGLRSTNKSGIPNIYFQKSKRLWVVESNVLGCRIRKRFKQFEAAITASKTLPNREFMSCYIPDATDTTDNTGV